MVSARPPGPAVQSPGGALAGAADLRAARPDSFPPYWMPQPLLPVLPPPSSPCAAGSCGPSGGEVKQESAGGRGRGRKGWEVSGTGLEGRRPRQSGAEKSRRRGPAPPPPAANPPQQRLCSPDRRSARPSGHASLPLREPFPATACPSTPAPGSQRPALPPAPLLEAAPPPPSSSPHPVRWPPPLPPPGSGPQHRQHGGCENLQ